LPSDAPDSLTVLYDADCGFCRWTLATLLVWDRDARLYPITIQSAEGQELLRDIPPDLRLASAHAVTPEGHVYSGGAAVEPVARLLPGGGPFAAASRALERPVDRGYRWVAGHRVGLSRFVPARAKARAEARLERHRRRARVRVP
jgi:predicted DCC family thiol-disulfide oxidoreductase YuxK